MTCLVFSVTHLSTKKGKTPLEFLGLSLDASVFDHVMSAKGVSGLKRFFGSVAFLQPAFSMPALSQPSASIRRQQLSCSVSGWSLFGLSKGFLCPPLETWVFTEKHTLYFLSEHLSSLVVCPVSLQEEIKWTCECSNLPQTRSCLKRNCFWFKQSHFELMEKLPELFCVSRVFSQSYDAETSKSLSFKTLLCNNF